MIPLVHTMNKTLTMESEDSEELFNLSSLAFNLFAYTHRDLLSTIVAGNIRYSTLCNEMTFFRHLHLYFGKIRKWKGD